MQVVSGGGFFVGVGVDIVMTYDKSLMYLPAGRL